MRYILLILAMFAFSVEAKSTVNIKHVYYPVMAYSEMDVLEVLRNSTPIEDNGRKYHGYAKYQIKWKYWYKKSENYCRIKKVNTTVDLTYTLPQLSENLANTRLKKIWWQWLPKLTDHEYGHGLLAIDTAREIENSIQRLPSSNDCKSLGENANKIGYKLMADLKFANKEYDEKTMHGKTQGGWLGPYLKL